MKNKIINILSLLLGRRLYLLLIDFKNQWEAYYLSKISSSKNSYSQHGEDVFILRILNHFNLNDNQSFLYVDIGANHPIKISNSYLLYKSGMRGVIVEPNYNLCKLYASIRPGDVALNVGIGSVSGIVRFLMTSSHARNSFNSNGDFLTENNIKIFSNNYIPVLSLDNLFTEFNQKISFLSIDVEGMEVLTLKGAHKVLSETYFLCIEMNSKRERDEILTELKDRFGILKVIGANCIMYNKKLFTEKGFSVEECIGLFKKI